MFAEKIDQFAAFVSPYVDQLAENAAANPVAAIAALAIVAGLWQCVAPAFSAARYGASH